ncbi:hypothetical protein L1049_000250 [Liquidambar formosana]|uniref:HAT C-terminal dimerisation domain-containing protein n=1 Tax=Liquidambar formosana TaxID=63359 RepID=A0AAP0R586_LIQFO
MGYIYEAIDRTKKAIGKSFNSNEDKYHEAFGYIDERWSCQLHQPLHAAGYFLNPEFFYANLYIEQDEEVITGLYKSITRAVPSLTKQDKITEELTMYKRAESLFGIDMAIRQRKTKAPAEWWASYGSLTPNLQQFAVKVLSLTHSASVPLDEEEEANSEEIEEEDDTGYKSNDSKADDDDDDVVFLDEDDV